MSNIPDNKTNVLINSNPTDIFIRDFIEIAIDGFLFRGRTPSDHYYRFSQSFPRALTLSSMTTTPKPSPKSSDNKHQRINNIPSLDLLSLDSNRTPVEQRTVLTIKTRKSLYSPKDSISSSSNRRSIKNSHSPLSSNKQSPSQNPKRPTTAPTLSSDTSKSSQQDLTRLEIEAHDIEERMRKHRLKFNRPDDLSKMLLQQLFEEKSDMQQELLRFENKYSKPTTTQQKKIMKPLYDHYRQLKRLVEKHQN